MHKREYQENISKSFEHDGLSRKASCLSTLRATAFIPKNAIETKKKIKYSFLRCRNLDPLSFSIHAEKSSSVLAKFWNSNSRERKKSRKIGNTCREKSTFTLQRRKKKAREKARGRQAKLIRRVIYRGKTRARVLISLPQNRYITWAYNTQRARTGCEILPLFRACVCAFSHMCSIYTEKERPHCDTITKSFGCSSFGVSKLHMYMWFCKLSITHTYL